MENKFAVTPEIVTFIEQHKDSPDRTARLQKLTNWGKTKARETIKKVLEKQIQPQEENNSAEVKKEFYKDKAELNSKSTRIKSLEDLLNEADVDLTIWEVERYIVNKWEVGSKFEDKIVVEPLFQVKAWLKKKVAVEQDLNVIKAAIEEMKNYSPNYGHFTYSQPTPEEKALEISVPDFHLGKLCWEEESGSDYDSQIAENIYHKAVQDLVAKANNFNYDKIILPVGNDFFNVDNGNNTTNAGTPQSEDSRWQKTFLLGGRILIKAIDYLTEIAPVDVVVCVGNHDTERSFYMGEYLKAWYNKSNAVNIDNSAKLRKYYTYGKSLIGYTHGDKEKYKDLPLIMASEVPHKWSNSFFRYWKLGHIHTKKDFVTPTSDEFVGVRISYLPSLAGTDSWHYGKGYVKNMRAAEASVYDKTQGIIANYSFNFMV